MDQCTTDPKFLGTIGVSKRALVDTTSTQFMGLSLLDVDGKGKFTSRVQHPTWKQAGFLGRVQRDKDGNVYAYPVPAVSINDNPPEKANVLYRVDSKTGLMAPFAELPKLHAPTANNPFGILAVALDCEQNALYVSTIMGSTASAEKGAIARVSLADASVRIVKKDIDALSLAVVSKAAGGKRLLVGLARDNAVVSYAMTTDGALAETAASEISLDEFSIAADKRPRVMRVDPQGKLTVRSTPFDYTLAARTSVPISELVFESSADGKSGYRKIRERLTQQGASPASPATTPKQ
jgi:hypothetical protein